MYAPWLPFRADGELRPDTGGKKMALVSYKCPNCGGSVVFDPKKQKFCCEFCMSEFTKEEMETAALKSTETSGTQEESSAADTAQNNNAPWSISARAAARRS